MIFVQAWKIDRRSAPGRPPDHPTTTDFPWNLLVLMIATRRSHRQPHVLGEPASPDVIPSLVNEQFYERFFAIGQPGDSR